jgi:hypothetical protein
LLVPSWLQVPSGTGNRLHLFAPVTLIDRVSGVGYIGVFLLVERLGTCCKVSVAGVPSL